MRSPREPVNLKLVNLKLVIEYDGKNYCGWQRQAAGSKQKTIQQTIEESLQVLFKGEKINLIGAGRTDAGVHAIGQAANFKISKETFGKTNLAKTLVSLNAILPFDIAVKKLSRAAPDFHARYSAKSRIYRYYFCFDKKAVNGDKYHRIKTDFNIDLAEKFCKLLVGIHSFRSLCKNKTDDHDFLSDVKYAKLKKLSGGIIEFEISASRFLHSMVRAILGVMLSIAAGKMSVKDFQSKFKKGEDIIIQYVPANALFLFKVNY